MKVDTDKIEWLLSNVTQYRINKDTGVNLSILGRLVRGERKIENLTINRMLVNRVCWSASKAGQLKTKKSGLVIARFICTLFVLNFILSYALAGNVNIDFTAFCNDRKRCEM